VEIGSVRPQTGVVRASGKTSATLTALFRREARGAVTGITLIAGFVSTVGWPLSALLLFGVSLIVVRMGALVVSGGFSLAALASLALLRVAARSHG
jgi:hypothetical protein